MDPLIRGDDKESAEMVGSAREIAPNLVIVEPHLPASSGPLKCYSLLLLSFPRPFVILA